MRAKVPQGCQRSKRKVGKTGSPSAFDIVTGGVIIKSDRIFGIVAASRLTAEKVSFMR